MLTGLEQMVANDATNALGDAEVADTRVGTLSPADQLRIDEIVRRQRARQRGEPTGLVYFVQALHGSPLKVGFTRHNDVTRRVAGIQTGNPYQLQAIHTFPGNPGDERAIHKALAPARLVGEWFECNDLVNRFYDILRAEGLKAALEACAGVRHPNVPAGWDRLWTSETGAHLALCLAKSDTLSKARRAGSGPPFTAFETGKRTARFYLLSDLKLWLVANKIPHGKNDGYWRAHVFELQPETEESARPAAPAAPSPA